MPSQRDRDNGAESHKRSDSFSAQFFKSGLGERSHHHPGWLLAAPTPPLLLQAQVPPPVRGHERPNLPDAEAGLPSSQATCSQSPGAHAWPSWEQGPCSLQRVCPVGGRRAGQETWDAGVPPLAESLSPCDVAEPAALLPSLPRGCL